YVVRNTRGVTGFVGPGSKPVPLKEEEKKPLGIKAPEVVVDFGVGDTVTVTGGVWENTVGEIKKIDHHKQMVTINVDMFGRETPVEISFTEVKKMDF
ncbi:MAG: transcription termination/antitermination protein NusG, partial [Lachnospiraceae bacterium]|nr:transcription termination/antitermination protein NusG [Lachnospiraceae bacterium]